MNIVFLTLLVPADIDLSFEVETLDPKSALRSTLAATLISASAPTLAPTARPRAIPSFLLELETSPSPAIAEKQHDKHAKEENKRNSRGDCDASDGSMGETWHCVDLHGWRG